jgi:hypothetical protein
MKKILVVMFALVLVFALAACTTDDSAMPEVPDFSVEAVATAEDVGRSAADLMIATMQEEKIAFTNEDGFFDNIGGYASNDTDGWLLYYNGELAAVGAADLIIEEGDSVVFSWENYDEVFNLE